MTRPYAIDALLDAKYAAFQTNGVSLSSPAGVKNWIQQRRAFLQAQLASVSANFSISTPPASVTVAASAPWITW